MLGNIDISFESTKIYEKSLTVKQHSRFLVYDYESVHTPKNTEPWHFIWAVNGLRGLLRVESQLHDHCRHKATAKPHKKPKHPFKNEQFRRYIF